MYFKIIYLFELNFVIKFPTSVYIYRFVNVVVNLQESVITKKSQAVYKLQFIENQVHFTFMIGDTAV